MEKRHAHCLCGSVKFAIDKTDHEIGACHCSMCRKWGGGPFMSLHHQGEIDFEGESNITVYKSSVWAERGFCAKCGSSLFYRMEGNQYFLPAGVFEEQDDFEFSGQIFVDEKPDYYEFSNKTDMKTGQEIFEMFAPKGD